jgi:hypothetical protein
MTKEQKEVLTAWCNNLLVTFRIDYFRGRAVWAIVNAIEYGSDWNFSVALQYCQEAENLSFNANTKDYTELINELRQIAKEVSLSIAAQDAIDHVFIGCWVAAIYDIDRLKSERYKQN